MSYNKTHAKKVGDKFGEFEREVLFTLMKMHNDFNSLNVMDRLTVENKIGKHPISFSVQEIVYSVNKKARHNFKNELDKLESRYRKYKDDSSKVKNRKFEENSLKKKYNVRSSTTIQRALRGLRKEKLVILIGNRYALHDRISKSVESNEEFNRQLLTSILKLHTPLLNNLQDNVKNLVNVFGSYILLSLLEIARPFNDEVYRYRLSTPMTQEEKNRFIEILLEQIPQTKMLYQVFLEIFLNQPDDILIGRIKKLKYKEKRDGKYIYEDEYHNEYDHLTGVNSDFTRYVLEDGSEYNPESLNSTRSLKRVPSSISPLSFDNSISLSDDTKFYYDLDLVTYEHVRNAFSKWCPEIFDRYQHSIWGRLAGGVKEDLGKDLSDAISS